MSRRHAPGADDTIGIRDAIAWTVPRAGFWSAANAARQQQRSLRLRARRGSER
jgi:hypothetical protein